MFLSGPSVQIGFIGPAAKETEERICPVGRKISFTRMRELAGWRGDGNEERLPGYAIPKDPW